MTLLLPKLSMPELTQIKNLAAMLPRHKEIYVADIVGNESFGETVLAVLDERSQGIKIHTISQSIASINWTRSAVTNAGVARKWSSINRDPTENGFRVDMLLISGLDCTEALKVLMTWCPYMRMHMPVWVHDADEAVLEYVHLRALGREGKGYACLVRE